AAQVVQQESSGRVNAINTKGGKSYQGLFQLGPEVISDQGVSNPLDVSQNITGGLGNIAKLWAKYGGNPDLVAMAINWGPGNVDQLISGLKTTADVPKET